MSKEKTKAETKVPAKVEAKDRPKYNFEKFTKEEQAENGRKGALALKQKREIEGIRLIGDTYLEKCVKEDRPPTQTGMALAFGFKSRETFIRASNDTSSHLYDTYQEYLAKIEEFLEVQLVTSKTPNGIIFALKNRGWKDTQEVKTENKNISLSVDTTIQEVLKELKGDR